VSLVLQCAADVFPLTQDESVKLWQQVRHERQHQDDQITIRCVSEDEITELNATYRGKKSSTNVLTFSYGEEHDVSLCMAVAEKESTERSVALRDYVALLLVHALLHATGLDHEESTEAADAMTSLEKRILSSAGFIPTNL